MVATDRPIPERQLIVDEWELTLRDEDEAAILTLDTTEGWQLLPEFVERMLTDAIERRDEWWTFDSLRHWYEKQPFDAREGVDALRRFAVSAIPVDGVGIAVTVDVETAFFTQSTVADFFDTRIPEAQQRERRARFERLTQRQAGQQGTLLYDNGEATLKCYFERVTTGKTCGNTAPRKVRGKSFGSMVEYYQKINPRLQIRGDDPVAFVSFVGLDHPQPVAARCLKVRVMNAMLPPSLIQADKIAPEERRELIIGFWKRLGKLSFPQIRSLDADCTGNAEPGAMQFLSGRHLPKATADPLLYRAGLPTSPNEKAGTQSGGTVGKSTTPCGSFSSRFWRPETSRVRQIVFPVLHYGQGAVLEPPPQVTRGAYKQHFKERAEMLERGVCYHFPPLIGRVLVCAYPEERGICEAAEEMMDGVCQRMQQYTNKPFEFRMVPYASIEDAIVKVNQESSAQVVVFVLNDEAAAYTEAALGLPHWRIKRITENTLRRQYRPLAAGTAGMRERKSWDSFLRMTTLDLFQEMDGIPFRLERAGEFEAQLVIDVSFDRRYYAQSVLIARESDKRPDFRLVTDSWHKSDPKHESINGRILCDDIVQFLGKMLVAGKDTPLASLLIARDGKVVGEERQFLGQAIETLKARGLLANDARVEVVELHKNTQMHLRAWEIEVRSADGEVFVTNVAEATAIRLSASTEVLITTGAGTLTQGTAEPLLVMAVEDGTSVATATDALAASAQLNWSSPGVAQRLPLPFKRTDEVLKRRSEQEIRRLR
jgi:hypothetical protein